MATGCYDAFIIRALQEDGVRLEGATVWDVGAHVGYDSLLFASLVGSTGRLVAFEPNPRNVARIHEHLSRNPSLAGRIEVLELALADVDGRLQFNCSPDPDLNDIGFLARSGQPAHRVPQSSYNRLSPIEVQTARADSLVERGLRPPSVMKVDVEGSEMLVLAGAGQLLRNHRPAMAIEVHNITSMFSVLTTLHDAGYTVRLIDDGVRSDSRAFILAHPPT
jgi:FkbM family methyltransferase